jgi:hypothetical protein
MKLRNKGLNYLQIALLNKGAYTNADLAKKYQTGARPVRLDGEQLIVPNRSQRKRAAKANGQFLRNYIKTHRQHLPTA